VQNKKELTISGIYVDKLSDEENLWRFYSCIFTDGATMPENLRK
jgi:hypothetical protein